MARAEAVALEPLARTRKERVARGRADRRLPRGLLGRYREILGRYSQPEELEGEGWGEGCGEGWG